ncbi:deaminase domain-containing protein [Paenibacillus azoreducens]|uniref:Uncharacterized protein n=1 Tax=Paenibacillus azoreducens TaxID=116718 RepID=A0A920CRA4_9BACL|nr:deaminase domain-containing protein [Paenibacillus azoreducens]GIO46914.1 hypothetical protein J34TS1_16790 [Paenibacillus azoreducens]
MPGLFGDTAKADSALAKAGDGKFKTNALRFPTNFESLSSYLQSIARKMNIRITKRSPLLATEGGHFRFHDLGPDAPHSKGSGSHISPERQKQIDALESGEYSGKGSTGSGNLTYAQKVEMFQARAQAIRDTLPNKYKNYGNVAVADVNIPGLRTEFKAHSRIHKENADGFSSVTGKGQHPAKSVNQKGEINGEGAFPRNNDTERKILEDIAHQLGNNKQAKGTIDLFTELPAFRSCSDIIMQFRQEYPNIKLNVYSGEFKNTRGE